MKFKTLLLASLLVSGFVAEARSASDRISRRQAERGVDSGSSDYKTGRTRNTWRRSKAGKQSRCANYPYTRRQIERGVDSGGSDYRPGCN